MLYHHQHFNRGYGHIQHRENHLTVCQNSHSQRENRPDAGCGTFTRKTSWGKIRANKQTTGGPSRIKHLVLLQSNRRNWKEISISGAPLQKHCQVCPAPQTGLRCSSPWHYGWHHHTRHLSCHQEKLGTFHQICLRLFQIEVSHLKWMGNLLFPIWMLNL